MTVIDAPVENSAMFPEPRFEFCTVATTVPLTENTALPVALSATSTVTGEAGNGSVFVLVKGPQTRTQHKCAW